MGVGWGGRLRGGWQPDGPGWILDVGHSVGRGGVAVAPSGVEGGQGAAGQRRRWGVPEWGAPRVDRRTDGAG
jgi:hypothetical protein